MYLPLTGYTRDDKRGTKMKVGSVTSQVVAPTRPGQGVQTQNQEVNNQQNNRQPIQQESDQPPSEKFNCHNSKSSMSTEDFLQLHNSSTQDMVDAIKDVMALKVLEKTLEVIDKILKIKKCKFFLATGEDNEEQVILNEILDTKYRNFCVPLDKFSIRETLPIIKNCNLSICNDSSFSHLSAALGVKTITLMADTPLIYGNYSSNMFPILPDGEQTVGHNTLGKEKINSEKILNKLIEITN